MKKLRFGLIALAVMVSVGGAFATKSNSKVKATEYAVTGEDGTNYIVTTNLSGTCETSTNVCKVSSSATPVNNEIPMEGATELESGTYHL